jgi:hypothetical protein
VGPSGRRGGTLPPALALPPSAVLLLQVVPNGPAPPRVPSEAGANIARAPVLIAAAPAQEPTALMAPKCVVAPAGAPVVAPAVPMDAATDKSALSPALNAPISSSAADADVKVIDGRKHSWLDLAGVAADETVDEDWECVEAAS